MNVSCSICAELFRNQDAADLQVTRCGHMFHNVCLSQWLQRKNTCPECRSKATATTVTRLYLNIADSSYLENQAEAPDLITLQNETDNLKFRILEKDGAIKAKNESISRLEDDNRKLIAGQQISRNVIMTLEQKLEQNKILQKAHTDEIKNLRKTLAEIDQLKEKLRVANEKSRTTEMIQQIISGTQEETEELLREGRSLNELATMVTTLKRELRNSNAKRTQLRCQIEELSKQMRNSRDEKSTLEEKCSILESELENLQLKNLHKAKNDSIDQNNSSENEILDDPVDPTNLEKKTFDDKPVFPMRLHFRSELVQKTKSPSLNIKSSSIAGLSPLLKRTKSAESYKLSPLGNDQSEMYSIMKKPRLVQTQTKKSDLRPQRLQMPSSLSSSSSLSTNPNTEAHGGIDQSKPSSISSSSSLGSKLGGLNSNRFRLGPLTKLN